MTEPLMLCSHWEPGGEYWLEILHAEPRVLFGGDLLRLIRRGEAQPCVEVDKVGIGGLIRIRARNRYLVYRLTEHLPHDTWAGEWPD
jgi:hypothetical protein